MGCLRADGQDICRDSPELELSDSLGMSGLRLRRNILRDQLFALGEDVVQSAPVKTGTRFFVPPPFHVSSCHVGSFQLLVISCQLAIRGAEMTGRASLDRADECVRPYIPGSFIPASLLAKLALPICLNIFFICAYWRSRLLTSCTLVPEPRAMRLRRLPLMTSWCRRSWTVIELMMASTRLICFSSTLSACFCNPAKGPMLGNIPMMLWIDPIF